MKKVPKGTKLNWNKSTLGTFKPKIHWEGRKPEKPWEPPIVWDVPRAEFKNKPTGTTPKPLPEGDATTVAQAMREARRKAKNTKWLEYLNRKWEREYGNMSEGTEVH